MSTRWFLAVVALFAVSAQGQEANFDFREAGGDAAVRQLFANFMKWSGNRTDDLEHAAFMVRDGDGNLSCVQWPYANTAHARAYAGVVPSGAVAILRIQGWGNERPSSADAAQSVRTGLPIYTLTRWNIYAVDPASGENVPIVRGEDWSRNVAVSAQGRCSQMTSWRRIEEKSTRLAQPTKTAGVARPKP